MLVYVLVILKAIDENKPIPSDAAAWLKQGFIRSMRKGELLHHALNLSGLRHKYLLSVRNKHLYAAWCLTDESLSSWRRSGDLLLKIESFKSSRWSNIKYLSHPPVNLSPMSLNIFFALKTDVKMPATNRQIHDIVKTMRQVNFSNLMI